MSIIYVCLVFVVPSELWSVHVLRSRLYVLYVSCGLMEKHELRIGKVKARDQEADYWLQIACVVCDHVHSHTNKHIVPAFCQVA